MKARIGVFCLLAALVVFSFGCSKAVDEGSYKYKIYIGSVDTQNLIVYSDSYTIDANGFLIITSPNIPGETQIGRVICSPGTYFILEK